MSESSHLTATQTIQQVRTDSSTIGVPNAPSATLRLSVVLITWNERDVLHRCLQTVIPSLDPLRDEVIVVDNGSSDGTEELIRKSCSAIRYYKLSKNIGVGPARNRGVASARGRFVMILDSDTRLLGGKIGDEVEQILTEYPDIGLFSFRLLNEDGSVQRNIRRFPTILHPLLARFKWLRDSSYGKRNFNHHHMMEVDLSTAKQAIDADYVLGANQVFRKETFDRLCGYDERIFFGPEDADFCLRIHRLNLRVCLVPRLDIEHTHRRRTRRASLLALRHLFGFCYFFWKEKAIWKIRP